MKGFKEQDMPYFSLLSDGISTRDFLDDTIRGLVFSDEKDAFYVADLGDVVQKHARWLEHLPLVSPFYAVKCNDELPVLRALAAMGAGFDCASKNEMALVLGLGVPAERIIYANPCKQVSHIKYAARHGVHTMTFDNEAELEKVARNHPHARLVLRIMADDSKAVCRLSVKFGASLKSCRHLLERARQLGVDVIGVSFHVGSGCMEAETFALAIADARCVFDMAVEFGYCLSLLDIGGGFPGSPDAKVTFEEIAGVLNGALERYFPAESGVRVIAEPGRFYVASAFMLAVGIIAKKAVVQNSLDNEEASRDDQPAYMYYVNDGVYGSFNCILFDHANVLPLTHRKVDPDEPLFETSVWGPTCDGLDRVLECVLLPELHLGDWLIFQHMGAYTLAAASTFNGFQKPVVHYVMSSEDRLLMQELLSGMEEVVLGPCLQSSCGDKLGLPPTHLPPGVNA
ncbi:ornithine decarboxylase-like [Lampetra fluviatilis]